MSTVAAPSSVETPSGAGVPKRFAKSKLIIIGILITVVLVASGGGYLYFRGKAKANTAKSRPAAEDVESTESEGESNSDSDSDHSADGEDGEAKPDLKQASDKKATPSKIGAKALGLTHDGEVENVIELQPFVVNLADVAEIAYLRMGISVGMGKSEEGESSEEESKVSPLLTSRLRNAFLALLMTKTSADLATQEGKVQLRRELLKVAKSVVHDQEINAIYITEFLIQK